MDCWICKKTINVGSARYLLMRCLSVGCCCTYYELYVVCINKRRWKILNMVTVITSTVCQYTSCFILSTYLFNFCLIIILMIDLWLWPRKSQYETAIFLEHILEYICLWKLLLYKTAFLWHFCSSDRPTYYSNNKGILLCKFEFYLAF